MKKKIVWAAVGALMVLSMGSCSFGITSDSGTSNSSSSLVESETHSYVKHDAVAATCETAGNAEYYTCNDCDKIFDAAQKEIAAIPTIAALGHAYEWHVEKTGTCVTKGEIAHYTCDVCDKTFDASKKEITSIEGSLDASMHAGAVEVVVQTQPTKLQYKAGETFDPTGMVAIYKCASCAGEPIDVRYLTYTYQTADVYTVLLPFRQH